MHVQGSSQLFIIVVIAWHGLQVTALKHPKPRNTILSNGSSVSVDWPGTHRAGVTGEEVANFHARELTQPPIRREMKYLFGNLSHDSWYLLIRKFMKNMGAPLDTEQPVQDFRIEEYLMLLCIVVPVVLFLYHMVNNYVADFRNACLKEIEKKDSTNGLLAQKARKGKAGSPIHHEQSEDCNSLSCVPRQKDQGEALYCKVEAESGAGKFEVAGKAKLGKSGDPTVSLCERPVPTLLTLHKDKLLDTFVLCHAYQTISSVARGMPLASWLTGVTTLIICAYAGYWHYILPHATAYTFWVAGCSWCTLICLIVGLVRCSLHNKNDWRAMWDDREQQQTMDLNEAMDWNDVMHIVLIPSYHTPREILQDTLKSLEQYSLAKTNMIVCVGLEQREEAAAQKDAALRLEWSNRFQLLAVTHHPADLPNEIIGKASNTSWCFRELTKELRSKHGFSNADLDRCICTVLDDDSLVHENYFEALTYKYLKAQSTGRQHLTIWQSPIAHFKNFGTQPFMVRVASVFASCHELACLANPFDYALPFSSYSLSFHLADSVGGWDADWISEDWHMMGKICIMTEGLARCEPIFLPTLNYAPEDTTVLKTYHARWVQAKRHALGLGELVYTTSSTFLGLIEVPGVTRRARMLFRLFPLFAKMWHVHMTVATMAFVPLLAHLLTNYATAQRPWCQLSDLSATCQTCCVTQLRDAGLSQYQIILHSWLVQLQQWAHVSMWIGLSLLGGTGAFYTVLVKDFIKGVCPCVQWHPILVWIWVELQVIVYGPVVSIVFAVTEWMAAVHIIFKLKTDHAVAAMLGRKLDEKL